MPASAGLPCGFIAASLPGSAATPLPCAITLNMRLQLLRQQQQQQQ